MEPLTEAGRSYRARKAQGHQKDLYLKQIQRIGMQASQSGRAASSNSHRSEGRFPRLPSTARSSSTATPRAPRGTSVFRLGFGSAGGESNEDEGTGVQVSDWMDAQTLEPPEYLDPSILETEPKAAVADVSVVETELIELLSSLRRHRRDHAHVPNVDRLSACFTGMNRLIKSRTIPYAPLQEFLQLAIHEIHAAVFQPKQADSNPGKGEEGQGTQPQPFFLECEHLREAELGWEQEREGLNQRVADLEAQLEREGEQHKEEQDKWKEEREAMSGLQDQVAFQQLQVRALRGHVTALKAQLKDLHDAMGESHERFRNIAASKGDAPEWMSLIEQSNLDLEQIIAPGVNEEPAGKSGWAILGVGGGPPNQRLPTPDKASPPAPQPQPPAIPPPRPPSQSSNPNECEERAEEEGGEAEEELQVPDDDPEQRRLEEIHSRGRSNRRSPPRHHPLTRRHHGSLGLM